MNYLLLLSSISLGNINDGQYVNIELYNNSCSNITYYESIIVPVKCNCFTTKKHCINKIDKKIIFPDYLGYLEKYFRDKRKCHKINNQTYFNYQYSLSNEYCSRFKLIFSLIFILIIIILGIVFYKNQKKIHNIYERLNDIELEEI